MNLSAEQVYHRRTVIALIPFMVAVPGFIIAAILWLFSPSQQSSYSIALGVIVDFFLFYEYAVLQKLNRTSS